MNKLSKFAVIVLLAQFSITGQVEAATATKVSFTKVVASDSAISTSWSVNKKMANVSYLIKYADSESSSTKSLKTKSRAANLSGLNSLTHYHITIYMYQGTKQIAKSLTQTVATTEPGVHNLVGTNATYSSVELAWNMNAAYTGYILRVDNKTTLNVKNSPYILTGLNPEISHEVEVAGLIGEKTGAYSEPISIELQTGGPQLLSATGATTTSVNFAWSEITGANSYRVYRDSIYLESIKTNSYKLVGLTPGTTGLFEVSAVFGTFETDKAPIKFGSLVETPIAPTAISSTATSVIISWKADPNATGYAINLNDYAGTFLRSYIASASATSYTITGLSTLTPYTVNLINKYGENSSKPSASSSFTTAKEIPTGLSASLVKTTTLNLAWNQIAGSIGYEVFKDGILLYTATDASITSYSVTGLLPGFTHAFTVRARYYDLLKVIYVSDLSNVLNVNMAGDSAYAPSSGTPTIVLPYANVPIVGAVLTSTPGVWTSVPSVSGYTYQWQKSLDGGTTWHDLNAATSSSYSVTEADYQFKLRLKVIATNTNGSTTAFSVATGYVDSIYNVAVPILRGNLVIGQVLDATQGTWSSAYPLSYTYQWNRNGSAISNETNTNYTLTNSDVGASITCTITATNKLGALAVISASRTSVQAIANTVAPVITGTVRVNSTLSVDTGTWLNSPTSYTYQWQRSADGILWDSIPAATNSTYTLQVGDAGNYVRAMVYGNKTVVSAYKVGTPTLATIQVAYPVYNIANSVAPIVTGSWTSGQTLTANNGSWSANGTFTYQWQSSTDNATFADIASATSQTYVLTSSENSKYVRVRVYNTTNTGDGVAYSIATSKVGAPYNTAIPVITSSLRIGNSQSVNTGTWDNTPTSFNYQWQSSVNGIAWSNADTGTASSYVATFDIANKYIRVLVTATNATGSSTVTIGNLSGFLPPVASAIPVISGTVSGTNTLTTSNGTWPSLNGQTPYEYQWQKSSDNGTTWTNISGAMASTYALVAADQGYIIRSQVTIRTNAGTSTSYSVPTAAVA